ncbi:MAG: M20/M25/M40 family metallo-hydrolase [Vicinamibacterales bacterium]
MTRFLSATALFAAIYFLPAASAAPPADTALKHAAVAWDRGDYISALTTYQELLASPDADRALETIALQTGELYRTTEVTTDGTAPQLAASGQYATYETGVGASRVTHLVSLTSQPAAAGIAVRTLTDLPGYAAVFSPDSGSLAYLKLTSSPELAAATAELDRAPAAERTLRLATLNARLAAASTITVRDLASGRETTVATGDLAKTALVMGRDGTVFFAGADAASSTGQQIYAAASGRAAAPITTGAGDKVPVALNSSADALLLTTRLAGGGGRAGGAGGGRGGSYSVLRVADNRVTPLDTTDRPGFSADGQSLAFVTRDGEAYKLMVGTAADPSRATAVRTGPERIEAAALSSDGARLAYELMTRDDWEVYTAARDGSAEQRLTREIQHDLQPQFLGGGKLLSVIGEARHRRSYLYDLATGQRTRLFHNNTVRTIAPEYSWSPSADGTRLLIAAERDGDTVSPQRGVYVMDLTKTVTREELRARVAANLAGEQALRAKGQRLYGPIAADVKTVVADASTSRVYGYEKALFDFDSKHITRPGNKLAAAFLQQTYASFGYDAQLQWFDQRTALDGRTANVVATLKGTVNPELIYVVSSHYDSVAIGPGADDDSSGTAALLETARMMAGHPQPATIIFASFTGEEAGLLGSREFVRRAVADKLQVVGALNNDMVGWANDHRLDNTIRYSNPGIRDVQHAAAMQFTNLITYDALYYKSTDAAAYYEAYGDIVGGIGSYPVLGNPHYHQSHDFLETINHQLVTEVAKTTAATLMLLASSPARLADLKVDRFTGGSATLSWRPAPEQGVAGYIVSYGPPGQAGAQQTRTATPSITLAKLTPGTMVSVKAINAKGLEGWDWVTVVVK